MRKIYKPPPFTGSPTFADSSSRSSLLNRSRFRLLARVLLVLFIASAAALHYAVLDPAGAAYVRSVLASFLLVMLAPPAGGLSVSSLPHMSYEAFRDLCDFKVDDQTTVDAAKLAAHPRGRPLRIFMQTNFTRRFVTEHMDHIRAPFVLVSNNNHDFVTPYLSSLLEDEARPYWERLLANPLLLKWFATNVLLKHPKARGNA